MASLDFGLSAQLDARLNVLSGKFSLFAKVLWKTYTKTLAEWTGSTRAGR